MVSVKAMGTGRFRGAVSLLVIGVALLGCSKKEALEAESKAQAVTETPAVAPAMPDAPKADEAAPAEPEHPGLRDVSKANETAPDRFVAELETTKGTIVIDVHRAWSPKGADRFYNLIKVGYFKDVAFFRVIEGFMAQAGIHGDPEINKVWKDASIQDDEVKESNTRGMVSFATAGPNTRSNQFFINFGDNARLDKMGFSPFGKVRNMPVVDQLHNGYGEGAPAGRGPSQGAIQNMGNRYLKAQFPELDYILKARIQ